jgi:2-polyprenyl-6-hydroxyphenyl methylase/3-demethylubiquinone-9 3-methyltransferase
MEKQIQSERRFEFGKNWRNFLALIDEEKIVIAQESLRQMLKVDTLAGKTFLDIGSGSGLSSLAARRLGAKVHSFDFDPDSVACTTELKRRYFPGDEQWTIAQASALDKDYMDSLGCFDIVYSWGVLHHTGAMWEAIENAENRVAHGGCFFLAIYNDQGGWSVRWKYIKRMYNTLPRFLQPLFAILVSIPGESLSAAYLLATGRPGLYLRSWTKRGRGMSRWHDILDWAGGWPFEVAKPEEVFEFVKQRGFSLLRMKTNCGGLGCNEFIFLRSSHDIPILESSGRESQSVSSVTSS